MARDDFAELLRELKERSGLSYGVLGKRLHVSASTLHRYVNGEAVPADYAPVERLARLCKATPGELLELHRRWVRADALRGRKGAAEPEASGGPAPSSGPVPAAAGGPKAADRAAAAEGAVAVEGAETADTVAVSGTVMAADTVAAGDRATAGQEPGAAHAPGTSSAHDTEAEAGSPREAAAGAGSSGATAPLPVSPGGPVPTRARVPRRRRSVVLAAVAVAAAAVAAALVATLVPGTDDDQGGKRSAGAVAPSAEATPGNTGTGTGTANATATPGTRHPSPSAPASRGGNTSASGTAPGGAAPGSGAAEGTAPLVATNPYRFEDPCSQHYLVDREPAQVPPPPGEQDARGWVGALGGVAGKDQMLALTVQGTGKATVVLEALHVRVVHKGSPLPWNDYAMGVGCGGNVSTKSFGVDLDNGRPSVVPEHGQRDFPYKVSESDPEVFYVLAHARAHDVGWYLELEWSSGTRHGTVRIDDRGKVFRTSGNAGRPAYDYPLGGSEWQTAAVG
ncbi:helix-turn-helix domain-containing protein [Streptomyces sp. 142MFCol3.1]|uniref:helix-turn-helix domain-containing protein n=1 Tax=Streptomyces sp. 142MFCol3.1 TaxID=1172179 RepID=UPI000428E952|nr:helix-turn-helix transcriptional regulator [Streptomyces sp. 142MFCol3.1]